ncbi:unnamed protein product [Clavelina lepadiformis]|uniref:Gem-associated protein 5 TPR domain-containing protein n=2 Tax=Clavelina lepadiformis TaxID=159417 RepID=A0ABP0FVL3_CLALP
MSSLMQQVGLVPAGCQPWNLNMVASCGPKFAYCATLAVYIYEHDSECGRYKLTSINATHSKTINCISWNLYNPDLFATAASDGKVCVWNVKLRKSVALREKLSYSPNCIGWVPGKNRGDILAFCGKQGPLTLWNTVNNNISTVDNTVGFDYNITLFRFHHTDPTKFIFGHYDGSLSIFNAGKKTRNCLRPNAETNALNDNPVLAAIWDPLSTDYLLVARKLTGIQLVDVKARSVITNFTLPSKMISTHTLSWIDSAPGMFLTGDHETGILRLWSVSQSSPLESINVKATGFHCLNVLDTIQKDEENEVPGTSSTASSTSNDKLRNRFGSSSSQARTKSYSVPPAKVVCAFADGGVGLYNLHLKKWEFLREQGHIETIFDCKFKADDSSLLATASFDGTVKVWSSNTLKAVHTSTDNEGVIYSISWAPGNLNCLACGTRRKGVFVWDIEKSKIIRRFKEHGMHAVYCVAWNQRDSHRLASCSDDSTCVVRRMDGQIVRTYKHPLPAFGCDWSLIEKDLLATGCKDGVVRIWNLALEQNEPYRVLKGHDSKVFHVRWNPLVGNVLCTGSDDRSIRVWAVESETCTMILTGHTAPVRGLAWNYEVPFLLASGSWDSSLRLWDVRSGKCLQAIKDHGADIYGLTTHPTSPFMYATSSRDSTLRLWSLAPMTEKLLLKVLAGDSCSDIVGLPDKCMEKEAPLQLAGSVSRSLLAQLQEKNNSVPLKLRWFSELFFSSRRLENLWNLVCIGRGQRESSLSKSYKDGILHIKHLTKHKMAEAQEAEHSQAHKSGVGSGSRQRDKSLMQAADLHLKLGNIKRHCEILVQLGQWEKAIALAPAVSKHFWSQLVEKYVSVLKHENDQDTVTFNVAIGRVREAVKFMTSQSNFQEALLVAQSAEEGNTPVPVQEGSSMNGQNHDHGDGCNDLVESCCNELSERHYHNADPYSAAAVHFARDNAQAAINLLVKSNKLALALCLSRNLKGNFEGVTRAVQMLARQCESTNEYDLAVKLLKNFDPQCLTRDGAWSSLQGLCARCEADEHIRAKIHQDIGLPSPADCAEKAASLKSAGDYVKAMQFYLLSNQQQTGLEISIDMLLKKLEDANWTVDGVMKQLPAVFSVRSSLLKQQSSKQPRTKMLAISAYFGALLALRRGYFAVVKPLYQHAKSMVDLSHSFDPDFPLLSSHVQEELELCLDPSRLHGVIETSNDVGNDVMKRIRHRAGREAESCMCGKTVTDASDLPSHSDDHISTISGTKISGAPFFLEDQRSVLSLNEAIMWAKCNEFSPTGSGERLCPF